MYFLVQDDTPSEQAHVACWQQGTYICGCSRIHLGGHEILIDDIPEFGCLFCLKLILCQCKFTRVGTMKIEKACMPVVRSV